MLNKKEETLLNYYNEHIVNFPNGDPSFSWLEGRTYSEKFIICIGAGPWRFARRQAIQQMALDKLDGRDLISLECIDWFPLSWQNKYVNLMIEHIMECYSHDMCTMESWCYHAKLNNWHYSLNLICKPIGYSKVLSLFNRDGLKLKAFPIDRHVERKLRELGLPINEDKIIDMCDKLNIDCNKAACLFVRTASSMDNPDWSIK